MGVYKSQTAMESEDVRRAKQIMNSTTKIIKNRFKTGLLWKNYRTILPNSYPMALRRLAFLEKRISTEPYDFGRKNSSEGLGYSNVC